MTIMIRQHTLIAAALLVTTLSAAGGPARAADVLDRADATLATADRGGLRGWLVEGDPGNQMLATNIALAGFIAAWGVANWDYGSNDWHTTTEGWFAQQSDEGGADKAGHLYTTYALGRSLTGLFRHYGYDNRSAGWVGAASSLAAMTFMEFGDGFSPYGFSAEDEAMNIAGAGLAWLLAANPALDDKFALRGEYRLHGEHAQDFFTDYDRWRYYATLKLDGFAYTPRALRWVELHTGYYTRGYADTDPTNDRRYYFFGVGLSVAKLARAAGWQRTANFLNYYQPPGTVARDDRLR